jgi:hypothetical protein
LFNKAELALQLVGCPPQLNEAQLLLHLYAAKGLDMLGMLQGQYAFCLYDSKQVSGCTPQLGNPVPCCELHSLQLDKLGRRIRSRASPCEHAGTSSAHLIC